MTSRVIDEGSLSLEPGQIPISTAWDAPGKLRSKKQLQDQLDRLQDRFQRLWDFKSSSYLKWNEFDPPKAVPSQHLALKQLQLRFEHDQPIIVAIVAPAGFGKSELLSAWLHWARLKGQCWEVCATTGVAAVQLGGCTLHHLIMVRQDGSTDVTSDADHRKRLQSMQGVVIDEAMMVEEHIMNTLLSVLQQIPLLPALRRRNAHPKFGYRDIIIGGDLRQLPPASTNAQLPFWSRDLCYEDFEFMVLTEDRRHEKDPAMQKLKEMLAWGGVENAEHRQATEAWPVHRDVLNFVVEGYKRGLAFDASTIDLDEGVALFALRKDVRRWNNGCVKQIESKFGDECDALDVIGCDPKQAVRKPTTTTKSSMRGIQSPDTLTLRTCKKHRLRVMLLQNQAVQDGWANGTQARLLAESSWSGPIAKLQKTDQDSMLAHSLELDAKKDTDFSVTIVKDAADTLRKDLRYHAKDICSVGVSTEVCRESGQHWKQVQLALAYALTVHKSQGLTIPRIYPSLIGIFGFGMPYVLMTRTRLAEDMIFVGVPPKDVYPLLKTACAEDPHRWARALKSMVAVNEGFKVRGSDILPYKNREKEWASLQVVLQGERT